jgi:hypothetical protein
LQGSIPTNEGADALEVRDRNYINLHHQASVRGYCALNASFKVPAVIRDTITRGGPEPQRPVSDISR